MLWDHAWTFGDSLTRLSYTFGRSFLSCAIQPSGLQVRVISVVYRKRKLVAFCILWDRTVEKKKKKQYSTARLNTCCCYKHEFLSFCRIDTTISRTLLHYITYMLFACREVCIGSNCARGLEYGPRPQAEGRTQDRGQSFSQNGPTYAGK